MLTNFAGNIEWFLRKGGGMARIAEASDPEAIEEAARILRSGGLVAFPTETVYGLGADVSDPIAVARIFEVKARPGSTL